MKLEDLPFEKWFKIKGKDGCYLRLIPPIEDKYGNLHIAVGKSGFTICLEDILDKEIEVD